MDWGLVLNNEDIALNHHGEEKAESKGNTLDLL